MARKSKPKPIIIKVPDNGTAEKERAALAETVPDWGKLPKSKQNELAKLVADQIKVAEPVRVGLKRNASGGNSIDLTGDCEVYDLLRLQKTFCAVTLDPVNARASELLNYLGSIGADNAGRYNAAIAFIDSMGPKDQAEVLLLVQMYVTHDAAIRALSQIGKAEWVPQMQTFGNLATKLLRASQGQMEAFTKMRRGGEQVVRHIHVDNRGGQAVIAENVTTGGSENRKNGDQSYATAIGAAGLGPAMLGQDPFGAGVPIASGERAQAVPDARGD
jgi:hypothetical protein